MMHNIWTAARSVLAVLAGIVALTFVAFAFEIPLQMLTLRFFSETFPDKATLDTNVLWMMSQWLYSTPAMMLGGYVAAWLAPRRGLAHAVAKAGIGFQFQKYVVVQTRRPRKWIPGLSPE